jgi:hypothetical protein
MPPNRLTTFKGLRRSIGGTSVHPSARATEEKCLIEYLQNQGFVIATADDVARAIKADPYEEELSSYHCVEGVAVTHASDGWWLLFPHGSLGAAACTESDRSSRAFGDRTC